VVRKWGWGEWVKVKLHDLINASKQERLFVLWSTYLAVNFNIIRAGLSSTGTTGGAV
jgi:hypothetical protein